MRPKIAKIYRIAVWGNGSTQAQKIREGETTYGAFCKAELNGFALSSSDNWAVDVLISANSDIDAVTEIEKLTRYDHAVKGWTWNNSY